MAADSDKTPATLDVRITNWQSPKEKVVTTTVRTYVIDASGTDGPSQIQICDFEPRRIRLVIVSGEVDICLTKEIPVTSPDPTTATLASQGAFIPHTITASREFYGCDAFWINSVDGQDAGRVTVIKEFC